jgi:hypothetical protein
MYGLISPTKGYSDDISLFLFPSRGLLSEGGIFIGRDPRCALGVKVIGSGVMDSRGLRIDEDSDKYIGIHKIIDTKLLALLLLALLVLD